MGYAIKSPVNRNGFTFVCSAFSSPRPSSLLLVYCSRRQARKRYKCCPWGAHLLLPVFVVLLFFSSPPSFSFILCFLFVSFSSSVRRMLFSLRTLSRDFIASREHLHSRFRRPSIISWLREDTARIYFAISHRASKRDDMWLAWNCVFCFSEPEGKNPIISTYFFRSTNYVTINLAKFYNLYILNFFW